VTPGNLQNTRP